MPEGPPPSAGLKDTDSDSDDDIPMPEGPPPGDIPGPSRTVDLMRNHTEVMS